MPFSLQSGENLVVRFGKNLVNEVVYYPQEIVYDTAYGTFWYAVLDMSPIPDMIDSTVANIPVDIQRQNQISAGLTWALINRAKSAWQKS